MSKTKRSVVTVALMTLAMGGLTALPAAAAPVNVIEHDIRYEADDGAVAAGAQVTGFTGSGAVTIPDVIDIDGTVYDVVAIDGDAFRNSNVTSVVIGDNVTSIASAAFFNNQITSLTLGEGVTTIGVDAFRSNSLDHVTIPDSVTSIGAAAFLGNDLTTLSLGASLVSIGSEAFRENKLTSVTFPDSVTTVGDLAFAGNPDLTLVRFTGLAPTVTPRVSGNRTFSSPGPLVRYPWSEDVDNGGGFESPAWEGYDSEALATVEFGLGYPSGSVRDDQFIPIGDTATEPLAPSATGYTFTGWYTDEQATNPFDFADPVTGDTILYAGWELDDEAPGLVTVTKTVDASFVRVFDWELEKTGQVGAIVLEGDSASANVDYTVTATPGDYRDDYYVLTGQISLSTGLLAASTQITVTNTPDVGVPASCVVVTEDGQPAENIAFGPEGDTVVFDYTCMFEGSPQDGTSTATVLWSGGGSEDSVTEDVVFTQRSTSFASVTVVDGQATGDWETLGTADWNADGSATEFTYTTAHSGLAVGECTSVTNTAAIEETEQAVEETVEICPQAAPASAEDQSLAKTGADVTGGVITSLLLLTAGGAALVLRRRLQL